MCERNFPTEEKLDKHMKYKSKCCFRFKCTECNAKFSTSSKLKDHEKTHSNHVDQLVPELEVGEVEHNIQVEALENSQAQGVDNELIEVNNPMELGYIRDNELEFNLSL